MPAAPEPVLERIENAFWKVWEKTWWLFCGVLFFLGSRLVDRYGGLAVLRGGVVVFTSFGVIAILHGWRCLNRAKASAGWQPVEARILKSEVTTSRDSILSATQRDTSTMPITFYEPFVQYEYDVQGLTYTSSNIILANTNWPQDKAEAAVARYPVGSRTVAYADPKNPRRAVLEKGVDGHAGQYANFFLAGGAITVVGVTVWTLMR